jgi:hypothetical protein
MRIAFWTGFDDAVKATDAELDKLVTRGCGALVMQTGSWQLTAARVTALDTSRVVERCAARGIDCYFGIYAANRADAPNSFTNWASDALWANTIVPRIKSLVQVAKAYGCKGIAYDGEEYPDSLGRRMSWADTSPSSATLARQRGTQFMHAVLDGFGPGVRMPVYYFTFPDSFEEYARKANGNTTFDPAKQLHKDFWSGALTVDGVEAVEFWDQWFYKGVGINLKPDGSRWTADEAVADAYARNRAYWAGILDPASLSRMLYGPFTWANGIWGGSTFDDPKDPAFLKAQLLSAYKGDTSYVPVYCNPILFPLDQTFNWTTAGHSPAWDYTAVLRDAAAYEPPITQQQYDAVVAERDAALADALAGRAACADLIAWAGKEN